MLPNAGGHQFAATKQILNSFYNGSTIPTKALIIIQINEINTIFFLLEVPIEKFTSKITEF
jgi:hypothetical protein